MINKIKIMLNKISDSRKTLPKTPLIISSDFVRMELYWVQNKAKPAMTLSLTTYIGKTIDILNNSKNEFPDIIYKQIKVLKLKNLSKSQHWFYHKDNKIEIESNLEKLMKKYSYNLYATMIGHIKPYNQIQLERFHFDYLKTRGMLEWFVNNKFVFSEPICDLDEIIQKNLHLEKLDRLAKALPSNYTVALKVWYTSCTLLTSKSADTIKELVI